MIYEEGRLDGLHTGAKKNEDHDNEVCELEEKINGRETRGMENEVGRKKRTREGREGEERQERERKKNKRED